MPRTSPYPVDPETGLEYEPLPEEAAATDLARKAEIARARRDGLSVSELAVRFDLSERSIYRLLKEWYAATH